MGNRLQNETSPYLKQHAENPVEWYPWGPEALEKAKRENKPILLSVGYSACHWCHVMAHESFENAEIAALMNENFVNIKVDREERPDLDHIYQNVAQAITRSGGWPLTVFLLPDQRPFFGGTYFPPEDRYGRPGFPRVLRSLSEAYRVDRASVEENAEKLTEIIAQLERNEHEGAGGEEEKASPGEKDRGLVAADGSPLAQENRDHFTFLREAAEGMLAGVDWKEGGFGGAPKFPNTLMLSYLWRVGNDSRAPSEFQEAALSAVLLALTKMAKGGIYDQLGGGFHRYAVDDHWAVPHFEKMLYDNGLLLQLYSEVLATDRVRRIMAPETRALFLRTVDRTVDYLLREMEDGGGGFYAAQDADSEGEEGKFFVWDPEEFAKVLTPEEARVFSARYGVDSAGNFEHGKTVLYQARTEEEVATRLALRSEDVRALLASAERKVFQEREKRVRPGLDDKILVGWNGLLISGLVWAAHALGEESSENAVKAKASAERAFRRLALGERLPASIQKGSAKGSGFLDDYAFLTRAAVDLLRFSEPGDLERKKELLLQSEGWITRIFDQFYDPSGDPGFFFTAKDQETLLQRPKSLYDQAIPSGTSVALSSALVLGEVLSHLPEDALPECELEARAQDAREHLKRLEPMLAANPYGYGELASALLLSDVGLRVFGGPGAEALVSSDRDFCFSSNLFSGAETGRLQVCELGTCREFSNIDEWARSP